MLDNLLEEQVSDFTFEFICEKPKQKARPVKTAEDMSAYTFHSEVGTTISDDNNTEAASLSSKSSTHSSFKTALAEDNKQNDKLMQELNLLRLQAKQRDRSETDPSEDEKSSTSSKKKS